MAATNYTPIQLYYSTTASQAPTAGNLASGELAINITDGKLYYKDNGGVVQVIATKGAGTIGGSTTQIQYNNAGALAGSSAMTFNNGTNTVTLTTLNLTNALGATYGGTAQSAYAQGDVLYASAANTLSKLGIGTANYILTSTGSVPQWVAPTSVTVQTANNLAGGAGGSVPYQSAADTTTFLAIGTANRVMTSSGTAPQWVTSLTGLTGVSSSSITNTSLTSGRVVVSSTGGLQADDADLTFDGTTLSAGGYSTAGLTTLVKTVKIGDSNFNGVAVFAPATPAKLYIGTGTVTDTTSAIGATNATGAVASLAITPIAATNTSVTYTNAATLYIAGAPSAGTNVTITNPYALYVAAGASYLPSLTLGAALPTGSGGTGLTSFTANGVVYASSTSALATGSALTFDGSKLAIGTATSNIQLTTSVNTNQAYISLADADGRTAVFRGPNSGTPNCAQIGTTTNHDTAFLYGGSEQMRLTSTGLGIGTSSPSQKLTVNTSYGYNSSAPATSGTTQNGILRLTPNRGIYGETFDFGMNIGSPTYAWIQPTNTDDLSINYPLSLNPNGGKVGIGNTSPSQILTIGSTTTANTTARMLGSSTAGSDTYQYSFGIDDVTDFAGMKLKFSERTSKGLQIFTANGYGFPITFSASTTSTQMTLDTSGNLLVGTTSASTTDPGCVISPVGARQTGNSAGPAGWTFDVFQRSGTTIGSITQSGTTAVLYNVTSDQRLKENIVDAPEFGSVIDSIKVRSYDWKADGNHQRAGFVAQELVTVAPEAVHQPADPEQMMAVDYSKLVPMLVKEIQSLRTRLAALEAK